MLIFYFAFMIVLSCKLRTAALFKFKQTKDSRGMHLLMYANYKFLRSVAVGRRPDSGSHGSLRLACERRGNTYDG